MATYFLILTDHGSQLLAQAQAGTAPITISHLVLGDAHGQPYLPQSRANALALVNERARVAVQSVQVVDQHVEVVAVVDSTVGGFNVHEIGLTDADGQLVYLGNYHGGYKPVLTEGAGGELELLLQLKTNGLGPVVIEADPTVVTASRQWVLDRFVRIPTFEGHVAQFAAHLNAFDSHVSQNALEHANLLILVQQLTQMLAHTNEELMDTQVVQHIQQTLILMQQRLTALEQDRLEDVAVGDLFLTNNSFLDSNAVAAHKKFGTWQAIGQGTYLSIAGQEHPNAPTFTANQISGSHELHIGLNNLPNHNHAPNDVYNKLTGRVDEALATGFAFPSPISAGSVNDLGGNNELLVAGIGNMPDSDFEIKAVGEGHALENRPRTTSIYVWQRLT